jgi:hypothetical protein
MSEPTTTTSPTKPREGLGARPAELTAQPVTEPTLDVQPPWTVDEIDDGKLPEDLSNHPTRDLPNELVGAYLHG